MLNLLCAVFNAFVAGMCFAEHRTTPAWINIAAMVWNLIVVGRVMMLSGIGLLATREEY